MVEPWRRVVKGRSHEEDRLAPLDRLHPSRRHAASVPDGLDVVHDRTPGVARAEKVAVERVHRTLPGHRVPRCGQRLTDHLAPEHGTEPEILAVSAEQILFDAFELEELQQLVQDAAHDPSSGCRLYVCRDSCPDRASGCLAAARLSPDPGEDHRLYCGHVHRFRSRRSG